MDGGGRDVKGELPIYDQVGKISSTAVTVRSEGGGVREGERDGAQGRERKKRSGRRRRRRRRRRNGVEGRRVGERVVRSIVTARDISQ